MSIVKTFILTCDDCGETSSGYPKEAFLNKCRRWGWNLCERWHRCPACVNRLGIPKKEVTQ